MASSRDLLFQLRKALETIDKEKFEALIKNSQVNIKDIQCPKGNNSNEY